LMMPRMNGTELIEHVRHSPKLKAVPIIVITAASPEQIRQAKQAGANEVIRKPIDFDQFIKVINQYAP
ncbi:MAG: response regulator, partial [Deltaproteobacteria bacterium]|nr:response regulator [Deltaproteobacteria bacterium]